MATLKISDLSVGDWVRCGEDTTPYKIIGIDSKVHPNVTLCDSYYPQGVIALLDMIHPIPITAEILEKNGFADKGSCLFSYEREWRGDKSTVNICSFDEELWFADVEFRDGPTCMSDIPLIYINQLQHVLRLIGVDKEINL